MKLKKFIALGAVAAITLSSNVVAAENNIIVNGNQIEGTAYDNYLPLRSIAEALGYDVEWNKETKSIAISNMPQYVTMTVGIDGYTIARTAPMPLGAAPVIKDGITYVPSEVFSNLLDYNVEITDNTYEISEKTTENTALVKEISEDGILVEDSQKGEVMLIADEFATITDADNNIKTLDDIKIGDSLTVEYGDAMTMSLPPINNPKSIIIIKSNEVSTEESTEDSTEEISTEETTEEASTETTTIEE